jgi:hypothetical protein
MVSSLGKCSVLIRRHSRAGGKPAVTEELGARLRGHDVIWLAEYRTGRAIGTLRFQFELSEKKVWSNSERVCVVKGLIVKFLRRGIRRSLASFMND